MNHRDLLPMLGEAAMRHKEFPAWSRLSRVYLPRKEVYIHLLCVPSGTFVGSLPPCNALQLAVHGRCHTGSTCPVVPCCTYTLKERSTSVQSGQDCS